MDKLQETGNTEDYQDQNNNTVNNDKQGFISKIFAQSWETTLGSIGFFVGFVPIFAILYILEFLLAQQISITYIILVLIIYVIVSYFLIVISLKISNSENFQLFPNTAGNIKGLLQYIFANILAIVIFEVFSSLFYPYLLIGLYIVQVFNRGGLLAKPHILAMILSNIYAVIYVIIPVIVQAVLIYFTLRVCLFPYLIIDKKMSAISAIKDSFHLTKKYALKIRGIAILFGIISVLMELIVLTRFIIPTSLYIIPPSLFLISSPVTMTFFFILLFIIPFIILITAYLYKNILNNL